MRKEYDLSNLSWARNRYAKRPRSTVTLRLDRDVIDHFKGLSKESGIPCQRLMNLYLRECASSKRKPFTRWVDASSKGRDS